MCNWVRSGLWSGFNKIGVSCPTNPIRKRGNEDDNEDDNYDDNDGEDDSEDDDDPIKINPMTTLKIKSFMINNMSLCQRFIVFHEHNFDRHKYEIAREKEDGDDL